MFCPYCGNDCAEYRFCSRCGTDLQQKTENEEAVDCNDSYDILCQVYKGISSSIALYKDGVILESRPMFKKVSTQIRYDQITAVAYTRPKDGFATLGFLTLRWEGNCHLPMPTGTKQNADATTVVTSNLNDTLFYHIFYFLKAMAPASAQFSMHIPPRQVAAEIDMERDLFFEGCSPYRALAVKELCDHTGVDVMAARGFVDELFDARQKAKYEEFPLEAIRDLNKIVRYQQFSRM